VKEPRRLWKRYLTTNTEFIGLVLREAWRGRAIASRARHSDQ
jgi:UDP-N-acetyl-D-mannosaminuronic acid transferase (WecB/TagA/CpsF family)